MKRGVYIDLTPDDAGEKWKRTAAGALARLKECEAGMDREHGTGMNLRWLYWNGEWGEAFGWLKKNCWRIAQRVEKQEERKVRERGVQR